MSGAPRIEDVKPGDLLPPMVRNASRAQLFLFSAATNNPHRIHYDRPYAESEGMPTSWSTAPFRAPGFTNSCRSGQDRTVGCWRSPGRTAVARILSVTSRFADAFAKCGATRCSSKSGRKMMPARC